MKENGDYDWLFLASLSSLSFKVKSFFRIRNFQFLYCTFIFNTQFKTIFENKEIKSQFDNRDITSRI